MCISTISWIKALRTLPAIHQYHESSFAHPLRNISISWIKPLRTLSAIHRYHESNICAPSPQYINITNQTFAVEKCTILNKWRAWDFVYVRVKPLHTICWEKLIFTEFHRFNKTGLLPSVKNRELECGLPMQLEFVGPDWVQYHHLRALASRR